MSDKDVLISSIERIHTTEMGAERIRRNMSLDAECDAVQRCTEMIMKPKCSVERRGKNYYAVADGFVITVNAYSFTIITAHKL